MKTFYTSDLHFFHKNIIDYCNRPYRTLDGHPDVKAMHADLIAKWNSVVGHDDVVYHLGDFGFGDPHGLNRIRHALNGKVVWIKGNHDKRLGKIALPKDEIVDGHVLIRDNLVMCHYPPTDHAGMHHWESSGQYYLCGHVHEKWTHQGSYIINVGCDVWGYTPRTLEELVAILPKKPALIRGILSSPTPTSQ